MINKLIAIYILSFSICYADTQYKPLFETPQRFHPQIGLNGAVATQDHYATKVGIEILKNGGNAIDAAAAIGYALAVTLPRAGNLGGGGFMTIWLNKEQKAYIINYRETAPSNIDIKQIKQLSRDGFTKSIKSAGVPGTVAGLNLAAEKFGILQREKIINPAIELAEKGFKVTQSLTESLNYSKSLLEKNPEAKKIFFDKESELPLTLNRTIIQKDLAETLKLIRDYGNQGFYKGQTADKIVKEMKINGGYINNKDLENYQAKIVNPIKTKYKNHIIYAPPPPSSGGVILAAILNILDKLEIEKVKTNTAQYFHLLSETFNFAYLDRNYSLGDPIFVQNNIDEILSENHINSIVDKINKTKHTPAVDIESTHKEFNEGTNTTHYVVIDKDMNIVSNTFTLNYSFGSGIIIPGTGFFINNELDDFTLDLGSPNAYGLIQGEKNIIEKKKQPLSSMTPIIITTADNIPVFATGSPGGSRIITTVVQIILNFFNNNDNISTAVSNPRIHSQLWPDILYYEQGISDDTITILKNMGHQTELTNAIGSAQSIEYSKPYFYSTQDYRRAGALADAY